MSDNRRVAVVTGATSGIGQWTALGLARAGCAVVCLGRSQARLDDLAAWLAARAAGAVVETEIADFADLRAVEAAGGRVLARHPAIGILVNNAGGAWLKRELSRDDYEMTFAVNHLAPFLLTRVLRPALETAARASGSARIVNVASTAHLRGHLAFDDLMAARRYGAMRAYAQSKLANVLFTVALARRLAGTGVTANAVHPGVVGTRFGAKGGLFGLGWSLARPFLLSPEQGARESLRVALDARVAGISGAYFARGVQAATSAEARDPALAERLWRESEALVDRALARG